MKRYLDGEPFPEKFKKFITKQSINNLQKKYSAKGKTFPEKFKNFISNLFIYIYK